MVQCLMAEDLRHQVVSIYNRLIDAVDRCTSTAPTNTLDVDRQSPSAVAVTGPPNKSS